MKNIFLIISIFSFLNNYSQTTSFSYENFEKEFFDFQPIQRKDVTDKSFSFGKMVITNTKEFITNDKRKFVVSDYWNITTAFYSLKEDRQTLLIAFNKMIESEGACEYLESFKYKANFYNEIKDIYDKHLNKCTQDLTNTKNDDFNLSIYIKENKLNKKLTELIYNINNDDQKFRKSNEKEFREKQPELDGKNQKLIDSLYEKHSTYIGKSLVGEKFETTMWAVIQHSNLVMMEKYLPIIQKAVSENELHLTTFKMLLDRIHTIKYDYQFFGSQPGIRMADDRTINEIKEKYGID